MDSRIDNIRDIFIRDLYEIWEWISAGIMEIIEYISPVLVPAIRNYPLESMGLFVGLFLILPMVRLILFTDYKGLTHSGDNRVYRDNRYKR
jgi:hypothetical protein